MEFLIYLFDLKKKLIAVFFQFFFFFCPEHSQIQHLKILDKLRFNKLQ